MYVYIFMYLQVLLHNGAPSNPSQVPSKPNTLKNICICLSVQHSGSSF